VVVVVVKGGMVLGRGGLVSASSLPTIAGGKGEAMIGFLFSL
jgi:hypothetical protein